MFLPFSHCLPFLLEFPGDVPALVASYGQVVRAELVDIVGAKAEAEGDDSRVRALEEAGEGDAVEFASCATRGEVALMVRGELETVQGPTEGHSEMRDVLILLKVEGVLLDIIGEWLRS